VALKPVRVVVELADTEGLDISAIQAWVDSLDAATLDAAIDASADLGTSAGEAAIAVLRGWANAGRLASAPASGDDADGSVHDPG
jgi:hypothetical protein